MFLIPARRLGFPGRDRADETPGKAPDTIRRMLFTSLDMRTISRHFEAAAPALIEAGRRSGITLDGTGQSPASRLRELQRLFEQLQLIESGDPLDANGSGKAIGLEELGDTAIRMLADLSLVAGNLGLARESQQLEDLTLPMALWITRHGGGLRSLAPVVNALARQANTLRDPDTLGQLYRFAAELRQAVAERDREPGTPADPHSPWRLLVMNQAIIATRSHRPELIEDAYQFLTEALPEEASRFFEEGMQQMELLNYPPVVRQVVEKFHRLWCQPRTLH